MKTSVSVAQVQMKIKPKIEEMIPQLLDGEIKKTAEAFLAYLKGKKHAPQYGSFNSWKISYKGKMLCYIKIVGDSWSVAFHLDSFADGFSDRFKKAMQDNLAPCTACLKACRKGIEVKVFEKQFANICHYWSIRFVNPTAETLEYVKELIEYRKGLVYA